jgi:hypothetical protein
MLLLPLAIIDLIFSFLSHDTATLKSVSVTSKLFLYIIVRNSHLHYSLDAITRLSAVIQQQHIFVRGMVVNEGDNLSSFPRFSSQLSCLTWRKFTHPPRLETLQLLKVQEITSLVGFQASYFPNLKVLKCGPTFETPITCLPDGLEKLDLGIRFNQDVLNLTNLRNLTSLKLSFHFSGVLSGIENCVHLKRLYLFSAFKSNLDFLEALPLEYLRIGCFIQDNFRLPQTLLTLVVKSLPRLQAFENCKRLKHLTVLEGNASGFYNLFQLFQCCPELMNIVFD